MTFKVNFTDIKASRGRLVGITLPSGRSVYVQKGMSKSETFECVIHELTHAVMRQMNINLTRKRDEHVAKSVGMYATGKVFRKTNEWHR